MTRRISLTHRTAYTYEQSVELGPQLIRLRPAPHTRTPVFVYTMDIEPRAHTRHWQQDPAGNYVARLVFPAPTDKLIITVKLEADIEPINPFDFFLDPAAAKTPFTYDNNLKKDLAAYLKPIEGGDLFAGLAQETRQHFQAENPTTEFYSELVKRLAADIEYVRREAPGVYPPEDTMRHGSGSCRDSSWLMIALLRDMGIAARFVSGYLIQETPSGPDGEFHAWVEAYLPGAGWVGVDPTSGLFTAEGHIPLAAAPNPEGAAPVVGHHQPTNVRMDTNIDVVEHAP